MSDEQGLESNPVVDSTRRELEQAARTHQEAQQHADGLGTRQQELATALKEAKTARRTARAELKLAEKTVADAEAAAESLTRQLKTAHRLANDTAAQVEAAEHRHNIVLRKQAKRQEKAAARLAKAAGDRSRSEARRARSEALRAAEAEAREQEREAVDKAGRHEANVVAQAEEEAEGQRQKAAADAHQIGEAVGMEPTARDGAFRATSRPPTDSRPVASSSSSRGRRSTSSPR